MNSTFTAGQLSTPPTRTFLWSWLIWTAGFLAFPIAGVAGRAVAGRVDSPTAALVAGLVTGGVIGTGQWLVSRGRLRPLPWILATALGMGGLQPRMQPRLFACKSCLSGYYPPHASMTAVLDEGSPPVYPVGRALDPTC